MNLFNVGIDAVEIYNIIKLYDKRNVALRRNRFKRNQIIYVNVSILVTKRHS